MRSSVRPILVLLAALGTCATVRAQGSALSGVGPVNRSMGGTATAAPLDPIGTLFWNPAGISAFRTSQLELGLEMLYPRSTLGSSIPAAGLAGQTRDEAGVFPLPSGGFTHRVADSPWTFGLGIFPAAGFGTNFPGGTGNPILSPPPPAGFGLGPIYSNYQVLQIAPTAAYQLTERLSVGVAPIVNLGKLSVTPGVIAAPNDANGDGALHYASATSTRFAWGAGIQAGVYFTASDAWSFGAAIRSPQWFEPYRYHLSDELGRSRTVQFRFDTPLTVSLGVAFTGIDRLTIAGDVRFLNFRNTDGYRDAGFDAAGASLGLGWNDVFSFGLGAQYLLTENLSVRLGYTYNTAPIPEENVTFNVASPLTYQHQIATGASYKLSEACTLSAAYYHIFYTAVSGPYLSPAGAIPGAGISMGADVDSLLVSIRVAF